MAYEFQSTLFPTSREMCEAIAHEWLTAGGLNSTADVSEFIADGAEALADECIAGWGLDEIDENGKSWMAAREIDRTDIVAGFASFIENRPDVKIDAEAADWIPEQPGVAYGDVTFAGETYSIQYSRPRNQSHIGQSLLDGATIHCDEGHDDNTKFLAAIDAAGLDWNAVVKRVVIASRAADAIDKSLI
jgi:hypothetical protein